MNKTNKYLLVAFFFIALGLITIVAVVFHFLYAGHKYTEYGTLGDAIGGLSNPIIAIGASILTFAAFYIQYQANKQVQEQFKIQQFESQFYEMIRLHKENINEMKITGYGIIIQKEIQEGKSKITEVQTERKVEGRKVFVSMAKELIAIYQFCENYDISKKYLKKDLLKLSYKIFFFGSQSKLISSDNIDKDFIKMIKDLLKEIRNKHKESIGEINEFTKVNSNKTIKLHIKYSPFTGHENRLGHYYRHLYSTVKYVVNKEKEGLINYRQVREYLKILRSQMSNDEQLMLYYNYIIGFGSDWENEGYLTKYRMLHNLPIDKVKYAVDPRTHFKEFIDSIKEGEGELFEWGDSKS